MALKKEHIKDMDFRSRAVRSGEWKQDLTSWYENLCSIENPNDIVIGQILMLVNVLWYILEPKEYKALRKRVKEPKQIELVEEPESVEEMLQGWGFNVNR